MGEPEVEPGPQPGTLAPEHSETAEEVNRDTDAPLSPNPTTNKAALSETEVEENGTVSLTGEVSAISEEVAQGEEKEEVGAMAGDGNASVKEEEAEVQEVSTVECSMQPEAFQEAVIDGTEEVLKEEGPQIDHAVKREVDDQVEASIKEEVGPAVATGSLSKAGAVAEVVIAGGDDMMTKEEVEIEQKVQLMGEAERKEEDSTQTDKVALHTDQEMVHSGTNNEGTDGLQSEDKNITQDEETKMDESMRDDPTDKETPHTDQEMVQLETNNERADGLQSKDNNLTQGEETKMDESVHDHQTNDGAPHTDQEMVHSETNNEAADGLQSEDNNLTQDEEITMDESMHDDHGGDKAMDEDLTPDEDGDKVMDEDEDLTQDGDGDKAMEASMGVDGDGLDDDDADNQAPEHGDEAVGTNDGEDDEDDDPPPLPAKKSSSGRRKKGRPTRVKKGEEELCFICFDGGELVVCDRRLDY